MNYSRAGVINKHDGLRGFFTKTVLKKIHSDKIADLLQ